jgi:ParB family transcriptional regulator, chromosome partitioning protein
MAREAEATEISLAENALREHMHPADEFEAFRAMIEGGLPVADVAARFGVTETVVQKRLVLARVSPVILAAFRRDRLSLQQVIAFAVTGDHGAQERVFKGLSHWNDDARSIRAALTEDEIAASDRRVRFIGLKAYEKAGGALRRDLFADGDKDGTFILDPALLDALTAQKLDRIAAAIRKEGWHWIEIRESFDYSEWSKCERRFEEAAPLPAKRQAKLDALEQEFEALEAEWNDAGDDAEYPARLDELRAGIDKLTEGRATVWPPETLAIAGAVIAIGHDGKPDVRRGFVRPEDQPRKAARAPARTHTDADGNVTEIVTDTASLSAPLTESLTAHRSAALSAALMNSPAVALASVIHAMAARLLYNAAGASALQLAATAESFRRVEGSLAFQSIEAARGQWAERLPGIQGDLWAWCLAQDQAVLLDLLAFCAALTVDAVQIKCRYSFTSRITSLNLKALSVPLTNRKIPLPVEIFLYS